MKTIALLAVMVFTVAAKAQKKDTAGYSRNLIGQWQMQTNNYSSMKFSSTNEFDYAQGVLMSVFDYNIKGDTLISVKKKRRYL